VSDFLARGITAAKWKSRKIGRRNKLPADGLTHDLRVAGDCLSFWTCDPTQPLSLDQVVLALAANRDTVDRLDLVWLPESTFNLIHLKIVQTEGNTPAQALRNRHRDVGDIELTSVYKLATHLAKAVNDTLDEGGGAEYSEKHCAQSSARQYHFKRED
jgi:hypothetical protein